MSTLWFPVDKRLRVYRSRSGGHPWESLTNGLPQEHCYVNVLRDAMAIDSLDSCGVYFGTTGGQVYASADAGDSGAPIVRDLPAVLSVEVQTLSKLRRPFLRFFVCGQDLSHTSPDGVLPREIAAGAEPFLIIGAIAGG